MSKEAAKFLYRWYYRPGEVVKGYGFFINPYNQWDSCKFHHIFAFDSSYNLYVGQYSVYQDHIKEMFDLDDKREYGTLWPDEIPVIQFEFMEHTDIARLNKRLRPMCQRLLDYGMDGDTRIVSNHVDLWYLTINMVLKDKKLSKIDELELVKILKP